MCEFLCVGSFGLVESDFELFAILPSLGNDVSFRGTMGTMFFCCRCETDKFASATDIVLTYFHHAAVVRIDIDYDRRF